MASAVAPLSRSFAQAGGTAYVNSASVTTPYTLNTGDSLTNSGTITINSGLTPDVTVLGQPAKFIANSGLIQFHGAAGGVAIKVVSPGSVGSIINSGSVQASGAGSTALLIGPGVTVGSVINSGLIAANDSGGTGVSIFGNVGSVTNSGTIQAQGTNGIAFNVGSLATVGGLTNSGTIQADGTGGTAINVATAGTIGLLTNIGLIQAAGVNGTAIANAGTIGLLNNSATIQAPSGTAIANSGTIGLLTNSGTVQTSSGSAIINTGTIGTLTNAISGTIQAGSGTAVANSGKIGTLANAGLVLSLSGTAITNSGSIGTIANAGTVLAVSGNALANSGTVGILNNPGSILAPQGTAIVTGTGGKFTNGINNPGTISGLVAIDNSASNQTLNINTTGTIAGLVKFGSGGDTLTVGGGSISGGVLGQSNTGGTVNFNVPGAISTGGTISNVDTILVSQGTVSVLSPINSAQSFDVLTSAGVTLGAPVQATNFVNNGLVSVGATTQTITGNYTQTKNASLGVTINDAGSGRLNVTGLATIAGGPASVFVNDATSSRNLVGQSLTVISAGTLSITNLGAFSIQSNSPFVSLTASTLGNALVVSGSSPSEADATQSANAFIESVAVTAVQDIVKDKTILNNSLSLTKGLKAVLTKEITSDQRALYTLLSALPPAAAANFVSQLIPTYVVHSNSFLSASFIGGVGFGPVSRRNDFLRLEASNDTGMAAGDEVGRGFSVWIQPLGVLSSQDEHEGVAGYRASTYGLSFGADTLVRPELRVGLSVALGETDINYTGNASGNTGSVFTSQISGYGTWTFNPRIFLDGEISIGLNDYGSTNNLTAAGTQLKASYLGTQILGRLNAGYKWVLGDFTLTPQTSLQQYHIVANPYTTTGGSAFGIDEHIDGVTINVLQPRIGFELAYKHVFSTGQTLIPQVHFYYLHNFGATNLTTSGYFTTGGGGFVTVTPIFGQNIVNLGAGVTLVQKGPYRFTAVYDHNDSGTSREDSFLVRFQADF